MHSLATGTYTKHGRPEINARMELRDIIETNIKADRSTHFRLFTDKAFAGIDKSDLDDDANDLLSAVMNSWFAYHYPSVLQDAEGRALTRMKKGNKREQAKAAKIEAQRQQVSEERKAKREVVKSAVAAETNEKLAVVASGLREIMYLDKITLSSGKVLRFATLGELKKDSAVFGRIVDAMTKRGLSDDAVIGDQMTDKEVQKIFTSKK